MLVKMESAGSGGGSGIIIDKTITPATDGSPSLSVDFSDVSGYQNLTIDNFSIQDMDVWIAGISTFLAGVTYSYNQSTGILTATLNTSGSGQYRWNTDQPSVIRCSK